MNNDLTRGLLGLFIYLLPVSGLAQFPFTETENKIVVSVSELREEKDPETRVICWYEGEKPFTGTVSYPFPSGGDYLFEVKNGKAWLQHVYYADGQPERILEMRNGLEHGKFVMFYPGGQKYVEQFYKEGKPTGTWRRWSRDGKLLEEIVHDPDQ